MNPKERLLAQEQLIYLILEHRYIPQKSQQNFNEVLIALREINPALNYQPSCSGCLMEIAQQAKIHIDLYKEEKLRFMTFPKQEPEVKRKPGRPKNK